MESPKYQSLLGFVGILAFAAMLSWVFLFGKGFLENGYYINVDFERIGTIENGSDVKIGNIKVGHVQGFYLLKKDNMHMTRLKLWINNRYRNYIRKNSRVYFESVSIIGLRHINIVMPEDNTDPGPPVKPGETLRGVDPSQIDRLLEQLYNTVERSMKIIDNLAPDGVKLGIAASKFRGHMASVSGDTKLTRQIINRIRNLTGFEGVQHIGKNAPQVSLIARIWALDKYIRHASNELEKKSLAIEAYIKNLQLPEIKKKLEITKSNIAVLRKELNFAKVETEKTLKILKGRNGAIFKIIEDPELFDDLKVMAKRLKNAVFDIVFKKKEKTLH
ncbi:MCE family protein [Myxococcota bacterium]|nr:MCE family protein [Myxococcota bacterium]MBU1381619.1 MCE family protein [Myxococcota bacterium]MBU1496837.1 MCE family protein [Myxococcota bacterium]